MSKRNTIEDCQRLASLHGGKCLSINYVNAFTPLLWECKYGHQWQQRYNNIQQGNWCYQCREEKRQNTCIKKYGETSHMKVKKYKDMFHDMFAGIKLIRIPYWEDLTEDNIRRILISKSAL